jgi:hypothetical protein
MDFFSFACRRGFKTLMADVFRFLQAEAETLQQMQAKISNELHHLQVRVNSVSGDALK